MSDVIENREVYLCRTGTAELPEALKAGRGRSVPQPIKPVPVRLKVAARGK